MRRRHKTSRARELRRETTDAERLLWSRLRNRTLLGCKFRRQVPVGPYVVDFICLQHALVIEADGSQHFGSRADARREAFLRRCGFRVVRFWNNEVLLDIDQVCDVIARHLAGS